MSTYASDTIVPVSRSQEEIRKTLVRYGATGFMFGQGNGNAMMMFEAKSRRVKFVLPLPKNPESKRDQQLERTRWRCLLLAIKAKLECVASGITTFEQEFLAHIVMPNGQTVGNLVAQEIEHSYKGGTMQPLLGVGVGER